jgi:uncharacterized delta-60 repeat protein
MLILAVASFALPSSVASAAPGEPDTSFGSGGKSLLDFGGRDLGWAVALQPDGKIIVAGYSDVGTNPDNFAVARLLNPQGTFDPSFGSGGKSLIDFGGQENGRAVALQPDGKVVVAGSSNAGGGGNNFAVARLLNPQASLDPSFGIGGTSLADFGGNDTGEALALQPDGKIVVAGASSAGANPANFAVTRLLNPSGDFDPSFGIGGKSLGDFGGDDNGAAMALQPDGKIVVAGGSLPAGNPENFAVARLLNPQGSFDPSFGSGGKSLADFGGDESGRAVALQTDGKIVVAGYSTAGPNPANFAVTRLLNPQGSFDPSFGSGGKALVDFGGLDEGNAMALQADGKIIVAGYSEGNFGIARLQPNGSLDNTFGNGGKAIVDFGGNDIPRALALQPDGKIVVAGYSTAGGNGANSLNFAVARLQGDPGGSAGPSRCAGKRATIIGTAKRDKLVGTKKRDVIASLSGRDSVKAGKGNDIVCGGAGKDKVAGGAGKDKLLGEKGKDKLVGGKGRDKLIGGPGKDTCVGGPGKDVEKSC